MTIESKFQHLYQALGYTDPTCGISRLFCIVQDQFKLDPLGTVCFCSVKDGLIELNSCNGKIWGCLDLSSFGTGTVTFASHTGKGNRADLTAVSLVDGRTKDSTEACIEVA